MKTDPDIATCRRAVGLVGMAVVVAAVGCQPALLADPKVALEGLGATVPSMQLNPDLFKTLQPSNDRVWTPDQAVLPYAEFSRSEVTVRNIRNCDYRTTDDFDVRHYDQTFDLDDLESVDFIMTPFKGSMTLGHTMLSFGFAGDEHLAVSVEIRKELGESYGALKGFFNQYEVMYVVGDERDLIGLRTNHRLDDVYVYPTRATPEQARELFVDMMTRVNKLANAPEFYNTLTNNCTTNIRNHINRLTPDRVPYDYRVLLPGYSDQLAYELGLLKTGYSFAETRRRARTNYQAFLHRDRPDFSAKIRQ